MLACSDRLLHGFDPKTGKEIWHCEGLMEYIYTSPLYSPSTTSPVAMSGFNKSALAVKLGGTGDITKNRLWHHPSNTQRVGSGVILGDHIYILEETLAPKCYELETGKQVWKTEKFNRPTNWGSMVHADGRLYVLTRDGTTFVFAASPEFKVLATNRLSSVNH